MALSWLVSLQQHHHGPAQARGVGVIGGHPTRPVHAGRLRRLPGRAGETDDRAATEPDPDLAKAKVRLQKVEQEIVNLMTAIKAGIFTASTKAELEKLEADRIRLQKMVLGQTKADPIETFLPNTIGRFKAMLDNLAHVTQHQVNKTTDGEGDRPASYGRWGFTVSDSRNLWGLCRVTAVGGW